MARKQQSNEGQEPQETQSEPQPAEGTISVEGGRSRDETATVESPESERHDGLRVLEDQPTRDAREQAGRDVEQQETRPDAGPPISSPAEEDPTKQGRLEAGTPLGAGGPGFGDTRGPEGVDPNQAASDTDVTRAFPADQGEANADTRGRETEG